MAKGGYRKPANPAPVSGPGALSRRTDGKQPVMNMTGGKYGEAKALNEMQQGAAMYQQASAPSTPMPSVTGLFEPTARPTEPLTHGMPIGPGANNTPAPNQVFTPSLKDVFERALAINPDPDVETTYNVLLQRGVI